MIVSVQPSKISGTVQAPASKSSMQRACAAALVHKGKTVIHNPGVSNDDKASLDVIQQLGSKWSIVDQQLVVDSNKNLIHTPYIFLQSPLQINCGESGLGIRMFTPIVALSEKEVTITGEGSLAARPMDFFNEVLPQLGVNIQSNKGKLPLVIRGPLQPKSIEIDGSLSSQFLTGLLMAYAAADARNVSIKVKNLKSKPYIDLTLEVMREVGLKVPQNKDYEEFYFDNHTYQHFLLSTVHYTVEGDWSGAAFLLVAGAIAGNVKVNGLRLSSTQADKKILDALTLTGAKINATENTIEVQKDQLRPFQFDATDCPDLFPPLAALAASCKGLSTIKGLKRLKHKESDRGITLQAELAKLGVQVDLNEDEMLIHGTGNLSIKDAVLDSHHDHRIAMACAVAALNADAAVQITNADAVKKSYPDFWDHLKQLNAGLSLKPFTTDNTFRL